MAIITLAAASTAATTFFGTMGGLYFLVTIVERFALCCKRNSSNKNNCECIESQPFLAETMTSKPCCGNKLVVSNVDETQQQEQAP